jgi:DNA-binding transcriptional MerR regulator
MIERRKLLSIKEFARITHVPESLLRFYDNHGIFRPGQRGKDNNYRSYTLDQCLDFSTVYLLRELDLPLGEIQTSVANRAPDAVFNLLVERQRRLDRDLERIRALQVTNNALLTFLLKYRGAGESAVLEESFPAPAYFHPTFPEGERPWETDRRAFNRLMYYKSALLVEHRAASFLVGFRYDSFDAFTDDPSQPREFFSLTVEPAGGPPVPHLVLFAKGFPPSPETAQKLRKAVESRGAKPAGPVNCEIVRGELCEANVADYLIRILVRLEA